MSTDDEPVYRYLLVKSLSLFDLFARNDGSAASSDFLRHRSLAQEVYHFRLVRASLDARFTD